VQEFLLALTPFYFYFVPELLFPYFYREYVQAAYRRIGGADLDAFRRINDLQIRFSRILQFVAFLASVVATVVTVFYSDHHQRWFYGDCRLLASLLGFLGMSAWVVVVNRRADLLISRGDQWLERGVMFLTVPLCLWG